MYIYYVMVCTKVRAYALSGIKGAKLYVTILLCQVIKSEDMSYSFSGENSFLSAAAPITSRGVNTPPA